MIHKPTLINKSRNIYICHKQGMHVFVNMIDTQSYDVYLSGSLCSKVKEKERI